MYYLTYFFCGGIGFLCFLLKQCHTCPIETQRCRSFFGGIWGKWLVDQELSRRLAGRLTEECPLKLMRLLEESSQSPHASWPFEYFSELPWAFIQNLLMGNIMLELWICHNYGYYRFGLKHNDTCDMCFFFELAFSYKIDLWPRVLAFVFWEHTLWQSSLEIRNPL